MKKAFSKMSEQELKRCLLEGMCEAAETVEQFRLEAKYLPEIMAYGGGGCLTFIGRCPQGFKPTAADKLLFNEIIEKVFHNVLSEINPQRSNELVIGMNLLSRYYWPYYGWCDEIELERNRRART